MDIDEMAKFFQEIFDPYNESFGCLSCINYGTHHYPKDCIRTNCEWLKRGTSILTWLKKLELLSDGLLLGGLLTQAYSVILGFQSQNSQFRFLVVLVCLIISLIVGYVKFIKKK